jgi:hypothetical protein
MCWRFALRPDAIVTTYLERKDNRRPTLTAIHRDMALHMGVSAARNRRELDRLARALRFAIATLTIEIVAWVTVLIGAG